VNILILGGTQFFGKEIVRLCVEAGHTVGVFTRGNHMPADMAEHQHILGDRDNPQDLRRAAETQRWDAVIDNIAYNADQVRAALKAFADTSHYVLCSTISVYRFMPEQYQPMREDRVSFEYNPPGEDPTDVHWKYARGKLEAERECMKQRKVPWTILRPPVVYGPNDPTERGFWYVGRLLHGGPLILADGGVNSFRLLYSTDCARAFLQAIENRKKVLRKSYFIAQNEIITLRDFVEQSARALGVVPDYVDVALDNLGPMGGPFSNMVNLIPDISAAKKDFGFTTTPFKEFIQTSADWFRDHWRGNEKDLYSTREQEIAFIARWKKGIKGLKA
jgi:nucleoside-diphosphate-sugar epimerase